MFVRPRHVNGLRRAEHLLFAVNGHLGDAAGDCPSFGAVSMPLIRKAAVRFDADSLHLETGTSGQDLVRTPRPILTSRIPRAAHATRINRLCRTSLFGHFERVIRSLKRFR